MLQKFFLRTGSADHVLALAQLDAALERQPERLLIQLVGPGGTPPDATLAYIDLLKQAECALAVTSYGNLLGPDFALWLAASEVRDIRSGAFVFVPEQYYVQALGAENVQVRTVEDFVMETCYRTCLDLISEHVELEGILNRRVTPVELAELYLLDCESLETFTLPPPSPSDDGPARQQNLL